MVCAIHAGQRAYTILFIIMWHCKFRKKMPPDPAPPPPRRCCSAAGEPVAAALADTPPRPLRHPAPCTSPSSNTSCGSPFLDTPPPAAPWQASPRQHRVRAGNARISSRITGSALPITGSTTFDNGSAACTCESCRPQAGHLCGRRQKQSQCDAPSSSSPQRLHHLPHPATGAE